MLPEHEPVDDLLEEDVHAARERRCKNGTARVPFRLAAPCARTSLARASLLVGGAAPAVGRAAAAAARGGADGVTVSSGSHLPPFTT